MKATLLKRENLFAKQYNSRFRVEEASTRKSAKRHAGTVFLCLVTLTFDLWSQNKWVSRTRGGTFLCQVL